ncbi:MAG: YfhO family protein [Actinobacteria bacterium]|nr:YfhO family protein [Actinomycetota bacterium]
MLLRSTFDPGWQVKVDGRVVEPQMVAPSFVGAPVPPGRHTAAFRYRPFPRYDILFAIGVVTVFGLWAFSAFVVNRELGAEVRHRAERRRGSLIVPGVGPELGPRMRPVTARDSDAAAAHDG